MIEETFTKLALALGLGLLVGLQREVEKKPLGGIRTFALVTVLGAMSALLATEFGGWVIFGTLVAIASLLVITNLVTLQQGDVRPGITTEISLLVMFALGAYVVVGEAIVAIVVGGTVAVLLEFKQRLHGLADTLGDEDLEAIMRFVLLALVILPILPNRDFGPFSVLNPFEIWLMVVLIVGISLGGYIVYRVFGQQAGAVVGGILGGIISSTATTVSYARRSKSSGVASMPAIVIMIASTILLIRVLGEIQLVAPSLLSHAIGPLGALLAVFILLSAILWFRDRGSESADLETGAPSELKTAMFFGVMYAIVVVAVAAAKEYFGREALYGVAAISGLTDVDAITLSTAQLVERGRLDHTV
ncbi:MAG: DUF4010 domain-containing protein, partial [Thermoanaerobaculia bacterium]|nr:DUF4010 domain-containing protein [Thermoanaerobaculia bacterium]